MHPSGILTLSEAAALRKWGSRRTLTKRVKDGTLVGRDMGKCYLVTVQALDALKLRARSGQDH